MRLFLFIIAFLIFVSCNKEKRYSTKLMKGEAWKVTEIKINGVSQKDLGGWYIEKDVSIYDTVPELSWQQGGLDAQCEWQFQEKGKKFVLNYLQLCEECNGDQLDTLDYLAYAISGRYDIERHGRKKMMFSAQGTIGYPSSEVLIFIERK